MNIKVFNKATIAILLSILLSGLSYADDAEIFFSTNESLVTPNVLLILDMSGSMNDPPLGVARSKLSMLKEAVNAILDDPKTTGLRMGVVTFSGTQSRLVLPIADIDSGSPITHRDALRTTTNGLTAGGWTPVLTALLDSARYISNVPGSGSKGPFHAGTAPSPLTAGCQATHFVLMTDGDANRPAGIRDYMVGAGKKCYLSNGNEDKTEGDTNGEVCGRAFARWLKTTNQSNFADPNYITMQTIQFNMAVNSSGYKFLTDLASEGGGKSYSATDTASLVDAFTNIIQSVLIVNNVPLSGTVQMSAQSRYKNRQEVFYSLFKSDEYNYWPGNMKGFLLNYQEETVTDPVTNEKSKITRPILVEYSGPSPKPVMNVDGTLKEGLSSRWSTGDTGSLTAGGVVGKLKDPSLRNVFTIKGSGKEDLKSSNAAKFSNTELGAADDDQRKGLLDFIRGYEYVAGGSTVKATTSKIGDAARGVVSLVAYGCGDATKDVFECNAVQLKQVALLASNDGFLRGYDTRTGEALYEYMPGEQLKIIKEMQTPSALNVNIVRRYGLDGTVTVFHDDTNKDGYINGVEKAIAVVVSGRGGSAIYGIDISSMGSPHLAWQIDKTKTGFAELGQTWSVPTVGKIKVDASIRDVLVFGGGYDITQDDSAVIKTDTVGKGIYIVDAKTGDLIHKILPSNMQYSIPSSVSVLTNSDGFIGDIFVGDVGGQLWRFVVNNGSSASSIASAGGGANGLIASIASNDEAGARRFYHKPMLYKFTSSGLNEVLSVNIGSGYQGHPLSEKTKDRFYSLRLPIDAATAGSGVIGEDDLSKVKDKNVDANAYGTVKPAGFMLELLGAGEKVISAPFADRDRLVFNTYLPNPSMRVGCSIPALGTQRTYYQNLVSGVSLLASAYVETNVHSVPPDVTLYCDKAFCSIIASPDQLSKDTPLLQADKNCTTDCLPSGETPNTFAIGAGAIQKLSWSDHFDPEPSI